VVTSSKSETLSRENTRNMNSNTVGNALTIDVEDYFHVSAFSQVINRGDWHSYKSRVERNTKIILDVFGENQVSGTFFILGWVADKYPDLVREIDMRGHEVACHGYSHQLIYNQTPDVFRDETIRAKQILEDIVQKPVLGYRGASYSITKKSLWALDVLAEAGFKYDSSIFPVYHDRYGIPDAVEVPHELTTPSGEKIIEYPLSTYKIAKYKLPISGGGYFRLFPFWFTRHALGTLNKKGVPFNFYLHPWEIDPNQPKVKASLVSRFRHYNNLHKCEHRLRKLLKSFNFTTMRNVLSKRGLLT